jgi:hypothetical protein
MSTASHNGPYSKYLISQPSCVTKWTIKVLPITTIRINIDAILRHKAIANQRLFIVLVPFVDNSPSYAAHFGS